MPIPRSTIDEQGAVPPRGFVVAASGLINLLLTGEDREYLLNASSASSRRSRSLGYGCQDLFVDAEEDVRLDFSSDIARSDLIGQTHGRVIEEERVGLRHRIPLVEHDADPRL